MRVLGCQSKIVDDLWIASATGPRFNAEDMTGTETSADVLAHPAAAALRERRDVSLTILVRHEIERSIETGELKAGDWINEALLASRLGVSRGPVREACRGLEQSGLVKVIVNRGAFVREIGAQDARNLYELRAALLDRKSVV